MDSTMSSASGRLTPLSHSPWTGDSSNPSDRAICCRASKWSHAVPDEQRGVRPASALEYSPQVLVKARGRALADSRALSSFDQVDVVAEHAEPEGQVGPRRLCPWRHGPGFQPTRRQAGEGSSRRQPTDPTDPGGVDTPRIRSRRSGSRQPGGPAGTPAPLVPQTGPGAVQAPPGGADDKLNHAFKVQAVCTTRNLYYK